VQTISGPLRVCRDNPRYFENAEGKAIYLTGSHIHTSFQDRVYMDRTPASTLNYEEYIDFMEKYNHNFLRMWCRECGFGPDPRSGRMTKTYPFVYEEVENSGTDYPVYDLTRFNEAYFRRLRDRIIYAGKHGIYVSVMLFEGWSVDTRNSRSSGYPWKGHPYNKDNNINGIDGNPDMGEVAGALVMSNDSNPFKPTEHIRVHTLDIPAITELQKAYVKKVIETINELDNVMYEIANEALRWSRYWQFEMIDFIHQTEKNMPKQHPVWMSHLVQAQNENLYVSHAEAISPGVEDTSEAYCINPPACDGRKVIIADTDHLGGFWGTSQWVWKSFTRGINPIFMDFYGPQRDMGTSDDPNNPISVLFGRTQYMLPKNWGGPVRMAMGQTNAYAKRINLNKMLPYGEMCTTGYCLANPGEEYLVYQPEAGQFKLKLYGANGTFSVEWFNPNTGETIYGLPFRGGTAIEFTPPYLGEIVLYLKRMD